MSNPLTYAHDLLDHVIDASTEAVRQLLHRLKVAWERHLNFMQDEESYRGQVVAGVAAVVAVFDLNPKVAALLVALLGLHAAAFGHGPRSLRPHSYLRDDEDRWNPFS